MLTIMETFHAYRKEGRETFRLPEVVAAYVARPEYPAEAVEFMLCRAFDSYEGCLLPRILDAGSGDGLVTDALVKSGIPAEIVALDCSEAMADAFCRKTAGCEIPLVVGSFDDMPFADDSFDLIVFGSALHWGDPRHVPSELYRTMRSGGEVL